MPVRSSRSNTSPPGSGSELAFKAESEAWPDHSPDEFTTASTTASTWRDGRAVGRHIVDRALDYAALSRGGLTAAQIARRRKKSKGYVSIVLRLGTAIRGLDREELAVFRSERITWKLAQRIIRGGVTDAEIQRQLRYALGGFSTHNIDGRKLRRRRTKQEQKPVKEPTRERMREQNPAQTAMAVAGTEPGLFVWRWDSEWAHRDPAGYVDAYRDHLASLHRDISTRFREAMALRATRTTTRTVSAAVPMVGQSLRQINALIAQQRRASNPSNSAPEITPTDGAALTSLTALDATLCGPFSCASESDPSSPMTNAPDPRPPSATDHPDGPDVARR